MYTRVADEVWIATARLHCHGPDESEFEVVEIVRSAERTVEGEVRPDVLTHAYIHCVANAPPRPSGRYRMLIWTGRQREGGACSVRETPATPVANRGRPFRRANGSPRVIVFCLTGIAMNMFPPSAARRNRYWIFVAWARVSGPARIRTNM